MATTKNSLTVLDTATRKGLGEFNEDLAGSAGSYAWMFDGATDMASSFRPDSEVTGAFWISRTCDAWLRSHLLAQRPEELISSLAQYVDASLREAGMPNDALPPVCSLGIVNRTESEVTAAIVGDIFVYNAGQDDLLHYPAFGVNEHRAVRARQAPSIAATGITARRRDYLAGRNGVWVLGNNPAVDAGARTAVWPAAAGDLVLLATDGFARAVTDYKIARSWSELVELVQQRSAAGVIDMIRDYEASLDVHAPYFKKSDDACATLIHIS